MSATPLYDEYATVVSGSQTFIPKNPPEEENLAIVNGGHAILASGVYSYHAEVEKGGKLTVNAGATVNDALIRGEEIVAGSAWQTSVASGGRQTVLNSGNVNQAYVYAGGLQSVSGGSAWANISSGGEQRVYGGWASAFVCSGAEQRVYGGVASGYISGGAQYVYAGWADASLSRGTQTVYGGSAFASISAGGLQIVSGGTASSYVYSGGEQRVYGGSVRAGLSFGGRQTVYANGKVQYTSVGHGASQIIAKGGKAIEGQIYGRQIIQSGGVASGDDLNGGTQVVSKGGSARNTRVWTDAKQQILAGGVAIGAQVRGGGDVEVAGVASNTTVEGNYNRQTKFIIKKGGVAKNTNLTGGTITVSSGGVASATTIFSGAINVKKGATVKGLTLSGASLTLASGGVVTGLTAIASYNGQNAINFGKNHVLAGVTKIGSGTVTAAGYLTVKSGAALTLTGGARLQGFETRVAGARITVGDTNNRILCLAKSNAKTSLTLDLTANSLPGSPVNDWRQFSSAAMLSADYEQTFNGKTTIQVNGLQHMDEYHLTRGVAYKNKVFTIKMNNTTLGSVKIGATLKKNGIAYKLGQKAGGSLRLTMTAIAGKLLKGTSKKENLSGTANCDIFYGGAGNDTIKGVNGHDVVFYDVKKWGKDTIAATKGSITVFLAGQAQGAISTRKSGKDLVISRKGVPGDSITIKNYNENTHNIIFGGTTNKFAAYLNAAKPTTAVQTVAREAVWKSVGLLAHV